MICKPLICFGLPNNSNSVLTNVKQLETILATMDEISMRRTAITLNGEKKPIAENRNCFSQIMKSPCIHFHDHIL